MSDENRNEAGQFTAETEPKFGLEGVEADAGLSRMPDPAKEADWAFEGKDEEAAEIFSAISEPSSPETTEVYYQNADGTPKDPSETVTVERAGDDLSAYEAGVVDHRAESISKDFAEMVQGMRDQLLAEQPELAKEYGIEKSKEKDPLDAVEGLDQDARAYLKSPQIRAAIEQEFSQAEQVKQQYSQGLEQARVTSLAALYEVVPQLAGLQPAQFEQGLQVLAQVDPPAFQKAMDILGQTNRIVQAQAQAQQQTQQAQRQQFEAQRQHFSKLADDALGPMTRAEKVQMADELVDYVGQFGVSREQLVHEAQTNLALNHPAFQRMAADAVKWNRLQKAPKPVPTRQVPNVQKPGTPRSRAEIEGDDTASLYRQLDSAKSQSAQLKIAARIINNGRR